MLLSLHVKNYAIIDEVWVDFGEGMNILTGETGAGKSILLGSVNAALGGKVNREMIGRNGDYMLAELVFDGNEPGVSELLSSKDIPAEENLIIARRVSDNGRSVSRVNGETVSSDFLKELSQRLLEIYGQHENQTLFLKKNQLALVDRFIKEKSAPLLKKIKEGYDSYRKLSEEYAEALTHKESRARELSLLTFEHDEIHQADLKQGEDVMLEERFRVLSNRNRIMDAVSEADRLLHSETDSASDKVGRSLRQLGRVLPYDENLSEICNEIEQVEAQLTDIGCRISDYIDSIDAEPGELAQTEERLNLINRLKAKYGKTIEDILAYDRSLIGKIERLENFDRYLSEQKRDLDAKEKEMSALCGELSGLRKDAAKGLEIQITKALTDLNFAVVRFTVSMEEVPMGPDGTDSVEFLIATNPGEPIRPLTKVASGGELSRISLAVKSVFAGKDSIETLILDEIDTGVSGRTAQKVAEKMGTIAKTHQVLCITHLPQIAAMADRHFLIEKETDGETTRTGVKPLSEEETVSELARMLGGVSITESVRNNAKEMRMLAKRLH